MKRKTVPQELTACCALCEHHMVLNEKDGYCKYRNALKSVNDEDTCKHFAFDIFAYTPHLPAKQKTFTFEKI